MVFFSALYCQSFLTISCCLLQRARYKFVFICLVFKNPLLKMCFQQQSGKLITARWNMPIKKIMCLRHLKYSTWEGRHAGSICTLVFLEYQNVSSWKNWRQAEEVLLCGVFFLFCFVFLVLTHAFPLCDEQSVLQESPSSFKAIVFLFTKLSLPVITPLYSYLL